MLGQGVTAYWAVLFASFTSLAKVGGGGSEPEMPSVPKLVDAVASLVSQSLFFLDTNRAERTLAPFLPSEGRLGL